MTKSANLSTVDTDVLKAEIERRTLEEAQRKANAKEANRLKKEAGRKDAYEQIAVKVKEARALIAECEKIADEFECSFDFDVSYGMGGTYHGKNHDESDDGSYEGWVSSSSNC